MLNKNEKDQKDQQTDQTSGLVVECIIRAVVCIGFLLVLGAALMGSIYVVQNARTFAFIGAVGLILCSPLLKSFAKMGIRGLIEKIALALQPPTPPPPYFNKRLTRMCVEMALPQLSSDGIGIRSIVNRMDIKCGFIPKDGFTFLRCQVKRDRIEPLSAETLVYLLTLVQDKITNLLASEFMGMYNIPLLYNGDGWCIITVDAVKQEGIYILIDVIWVQDQRVVDYLDRKHREIAPCNTSDAPPVDEDLRND